MKYLAQDYDHAIHGPIAGGWRDVPVPYPGCFGYGVMRRYGGVVRIISHKAPEHMCWRVWSDVMSGLMDVHPWVKAIKLSFSGDPSRALLGGIVRHGETFPTANAILET